MAQSLGATRLIDHPERLTSNWLVFRRLPRLVRYCEPRAGFSIDRFQNKRLHQWPVIPFNAGVVTFASPDRDGLIAANMPGRIIYDLPARSFLDVGWEQLKIPVYEARRQFSDLGNRAFENFLQSRGLTSSERARDRRLWWGNIRTFPLTQVRFDWPRQSGRRQIIGVSAKRRMHWHYAVSAHVRTAPVRHLRLSAGLIFSDNGLDALTDTKGLHRLRRSFAKSWRNARWRDMLLAFLWWLGEGRSEIELRVFHRQRMVLGLPTVSFTSPASVLHEGEDPPDEDDPDVKLDEWDEEEISED